MRQEQCAAQQVILHKKWSFPLKISSVNLTKSAVSCGFGNIYWRNPEWKTSFFVYCHIFIFIIKLFLSVWEVLGKDFFPFDFNTDVSNNCGMSSLVSCTFCFKVFVDHFSLKTQLISCSPKKGIFKPILWTQSNHLYNPQNSNDGQFESLELPTNVSVDYLKELLDLESFEAPGEEWISCSGKKMFKDVLVEQETEIVPQLPTL